MSKYDNTVDNLEQLFDELKNYVLLQKEYTQLQLVEKLTILLSAIITGIIMLILALCVLFYLSFTLVYFIAPHVGGMAMAFGIITLTLFALLVLVYIFRQRFIIAPVTHFLANILLSSNNEEEEE